MRTVRIDYRLLQNGLLEITRILDKGEGTVRLAAHSRTLRACGRYVCHTHLFDEIDRVRPEVNGEFDEVPSTSGSSPNTAPSDACSRVPFSTRGIRKVILQPAPTFTGIRLDVES